MGRSSSDQEATFRIPEIDLPSGSLGLMIVRAQKVHYIVWLPSFHDFLVLTFVIWQIYSLAFASPANSIVSTQREFESSKL